MTIELGARRVPAFRSAGIAGYVVAVVVVLAVSLHTGYPVTTAVGIAASAGLSFFAWGLLRRAVTGSETLVLIEYTWAALAAVGAFLWASGAPVVAGLDVFVIALCPFLAFGRVGCLMAGCCHGHPSTVGLRYGVHHRLDADFTDRRLFPVPAIEAVVLVVIGVVGAALSTHPAGTATVWVLASYAVARFALEALRGDDRQRLVGVPVARASCVVQFIAALVVAEAWLIDGSPGRAAVATGVVLCIALVGGFGIDLARRRADAGFSTVDHLRELRAGIDSTTRAVDAAPVGAPPVTLATSAGVSIATSRIDHGHLHSLAHPTKTCAPLAAVLGIGSAFEVRGVTYWTDADADVGSDPDPEPEPEPDSGIGDAEMFRSPPPAIAVPSTGATPRSDARVDPIYFERPSARVADGPVDAPRDPRARLDEAG